MTILPAGQALGVTEQLPLVERHLYSEDYLTSPSRCASAAAPRNWSSSTRVPPAPPTTWRRPPTWPPGWSASSACPRSRPGRLPAGRIDVPGRRRSRPVQPGRTPSPPRPSSTGRSPGCCARPNRHATGLLRGHEAQLDQLADLLIDQETVDGEEVYRLLGLTPPDRIEDAPTVAPHLVPAEQRATGSPERSRTQRRATPHRLRTPRLFGIFPGPGGASGRGALGERFRPWYSALPRVPGAPCLVPTTTVAFRSSLAVTRVPRPPAAKASLAACACRSLTSLSTLPPGASHCGAPAATRRSRSRPSAPPSSATRGSCSAGLRRQQRDLIGRDVGHVGGQDADPAAQLRAERIEQIALVHRAARGGEVAPGAAHGSRIDVGGVQLDVGPARRRSRRPPHPNRSTGRGRPAAPRAGPPASRA